MPHRNLFGTELPIIQAPMAGAQDSELAIAVSRAGGLGSLPAALMSLDELRTELETIRDAAVPAYNLNFFCHPVPEPDPKREQAWRQALTPYYDELGVDPKSIAKGASRRAF